MKRYEGISLKRRLRKKNTKILGKTLFTVAVFFVLGYLYALSNMFGGYIMVFDINEYDNKIYTDENYTFQDITNTFRNLDYVNIKYLEGVDRIVFSSQMPNDAKGNRLGGFYTERDNIIFISEARSSTLHHEIAHNIWANHLNEVQREGYISLYKNSQVYINQYASTKHGEDFAESLDYYWIREIDIRTDCPNGRLNCLSRFEINSIWNSCSDECVIRGLEVEKIKFFFDNIEPSAYVKLVIEVENEL